MSTARKHFLDHYQKAAKKQTLYELRKGYGMVAITMIKRFKANPKKLVTELKTMIEKLEKEELALTEARKNAGLPTHGQ